MSKPASQQFNFRFSHIMLAWLVWGLACLFYFYEFLLQVSPSVMSQELMRDFAVTGHTLGILSGIYFYSYAIMQLPGGVLIDYFGPRFVLTVAALICGLGTLAFAITDSLFTACLARLLIGLGSAFAAIGVMKLTAHWFTPSRFAFLTGMMVTIGMLGAIGGEGPLAILIDYYGWRNSMAILGVAGISISFLIFLIVRDNPPHASVHKSEKKDKPLLVSLIKIIKNKQLWLIAIYGGLIYTVTPVFCGLWGVPFLMTKMHLAKEVAANYVSLVFIGWAVGGPLWGIYSNRIARRKPPLYIGAVGALLCSIFFIYAPIYHASILIQIALFGFGIFSSGFLPAFAIAKELCSKYYVATGLSFMNMMNMIGIALMQPLIGYILDYKWQGNFVNNVRVYPLEAYYSSLFLLPLGILIALLILPKVRETYCRPVVH